MRYIAVVEWDENNRVSKFGGFNTKDEAQVHVAKYGGFVTETEKMASEDWLVDPANKTLSLSPKKSALELKRENASLPRMDFMLALKNAGIYINAKHYAESLSEDHDWRIRWETAQSFHRMNQDLIDGAKKLRLTDANLDALFGIS